LHMTEDDGRSYPFARIGHTETEEVRSWNRIRP
jgi:hypothetical protein